MFARDGLQPDRIICQPMLTDKPCIFDLNPTSLRELCSQWGLPVYRADQVLDWVYQKHLADPMQMTSLSKRDRELLAEHLSFTTGSVVRHQVASDGTQKLLIQWADVTGQYVTRLAPPLPPGEGGEGALATEPGEGGYAPVDFNSNRSAERPHPIPLPKGEGTKPTNTSRSGLAVLSNVQNRQTECVMIPAESWEGGRTRRTACVSSQVGCPVGCRFCASGLGGLDGNLTAGQIVEQVWRLGSLPGVGRISNVVFMGMGEPLANFSAVTQALHTLMADWALGISGRRLTVSTVGLPAQIRRLAELDLPITLAISLHAPNDDIRRSIIPWAQFVTISELIEAGRYYFDRTGREVTLEYILLGGVNDQPEHARELVQVVRRLRAIVNLIRYNQVTGLPYLRPSDQAVRQFQELLVAGKVNVHIRASRGRDIAAACGQLRHEHRDGHGLNVAPPPSAVV